MTTNQSNPSEREALYQKFIALLSDPRLSDQDKQILVQEIFETIYQVQGE